MGEPLSPDRVFDFPVGKPEPHPAYDFFAPGPLPGYAGNSNNNNGWIEADVPLLGEIGVVADEPMVGLIVDEIAKPIVEVEEQMIAPVCYLGMMILVMTNTRELRRRRTDFPLPAPGLPVPPSVIENLSTHLGNLEYGHGQLVKKVIQVSDVEIAATVSIGEINPRVFAIEGQVQRNEDIAGLTQQVQALQCILGMDRRLADLERTPPGPQFSY
nr:hypothetical protein [Tanacetum cinerariifolium]